MSSPNPGERAVVVDASIVVKWLVTEDDSEFAARLLTMWSAGGTPLFAPQLMVYELSNVLFKKQRRGDITVAASQEILRRFVASFETIEDHPEAQVLALMLAQTHGRPNTYDAHYLGLAQHIGAEFWTADRVLVNAVGRALPWVHHLSEVATSEALGSRSDD